MGTLAYIFVYITIGALAFLIQRYMESKFKNIERVQQLILLVQKDRYNILLSAIQDIWGQIVDIEFYIKLDLETQVKNVFRQNVTVNLDNEPLRRAYIFIEKKSILLSPELHNYIRDFFIKYFQDTFNGYIASLNKAVRKEISQQELNQYIPNRLGGQYEKDLSELKERLEKEVKDILYSK